MATAYQNQKQYFEEFVEDIQDRLDLIIQDGIQVVFTENSLRLNEMVVIRYNLDTVTPEVLMIESLKTRENIRFMKNIMDNYDELCDILKKYVMLFNHLEDFTDKSDDSDMVMLAAKENLETLIRNDEIDGQKFLLKSEETPEGKVTIYLMVENYGSTRKNNVDMCYYVESPEGNSKMGHYQISKEDFSGDVAYQLVNRKCSHL